MRNWKLAAILGVLFVTAPFAAGGQSPPAKKAPSVKAAKPAAAAAAHNPCPYPPPCNSGHNCSNYPFQPTDCWTTQYGPAKADVIISSKKTALSSTNMLLCEGNTYALCFFSGPPTKTGRSEANNPLPCVLNAAGTAASCTCQAYTSGPNFVDMNGILNRGAYFETVAACGPDGSLCKNIVNCGEKGDRCKNNTSLKQAPVCKYVANQGSGDPTGWLMPKANLISTFSFAMSPLSEPKTSPYLLGTTQCSGLYAGCMTAPCSYRPGHTSPTHDGELVTCECPTYNGTSYQIGQKGQSCSITSDNASKYVWSASNTVKGGGQ